MAQNTETNASQETKVAENKGKFGRYMWEILRDVVPALLIAYILFGVIFRFSIVIGDSMNPTLSNGNFVLVRHIAYTPERGDIIVCQPENFDQKLVKRVIGMPGDEIDIDFTAGIVYVNGEALDEPYIAEPTHLNEGTQFPITVGPGSYFVMGDNRNDSGDSRDPQIGMIHEDHITGKVLFRIL